MHQGSPACFGLLNPVGSEQCLPPTIIKTAARVTSKAWFGRVRGSLACSFEPLFEPWAEPAANIYKTEVGVTSWARFGPPPFETLRAVPAASDYKTAASVTSWPQFGHAAEVSVCSFEPPFESR